MHSIFTRINQYSRHQQSLQAFKYPLFASWKDQEGYLVMIENVHVSVIMKSDPWNFHVYNFTYAAH